MLFSHAVRLYRTFITAPSQYSLSTSTFVWTIAAAAMMQVAYWAGRRVGLPSWHGHVLLSHLVRCLGRVSFTAATALFVLVFIRRPAELQLPFSRLLALLVGVFCMFCYNLELDKLANVLEKPRSRS